MNIARAKESTGFEDNSTITVDTSGLQNMLCTGRYSAVKIGKAAHAQIRVGKLVLWNVRKVQSYLDSISE